MAALTLMDRIWLLTVVTVRDAAKLAQSVQRGEQCSLCMPWWTPGKCACSEVSQALRARSAASPRPRRWPFPTHTPPLTPP